VRRFGLDEFDYRNADWRVNAKTFHYRDAVDVAHAPVTGGPGAKKLKRRNGSSTNEARSLALRWARLVV
jgi:hypothetical protein